MGNFDDVARFASFGGFWRPVIGISHERQVHATKFRDIL